MANTPYDPEPALATQWADVHMAALVAPLVEHLDPTNCQAMLKKTEVFCNLFVGSRPAFPLGQAGASAEREEMLKAAHAHAQATLVIVNSMKKDLSNIMGMGLTRRKTLYHHIMGPKHNGRPLDKLLTLTDQGLLHPYVNSVYKFMKKAIRNPVGLSHASKLLYVGNRDWATLDPWQKLNVVVEAHEYPNRMREEGRRQRAMRGQSNTTQASLSKGAHVPSLSARQAARSGVSQKELRAMWGC